jgi:hypothetical protein
VLDAKVDELSELVAPDTLQSLGFHTLMVVREMSNGGEVGQP